MDQVSINNLLKNNRLIVYGAGRIGRQLLPALKSCGSKVEFFWDKYWNSNNKEPIDGIPILEPTPHSIPLEERDSYCVVVTITAKDVSRQIGDELVILGYKVISDRQVLNSLIYTTCQSQVEDGTFKFDLRTCHTCPVPKENTNDSCDIFDGFLVRDFAKGASLQVGQKKLVIPKLGVLIGNKCNLCCKGCNHLVDLYKPGEAVSLAPDDVIKDVSRIVEVADLINKVVVVGGEAFLHPNLYEIMERLLNIPKIGSVQIITNGAVKVKNARLFELLSNERVIVEISGYGDEIPIRLNESVAEFRNKLTEYGVCYYYMGTLQWFDFGDFSKRPYSEAEHKQVYETCCSVSNDIWNGGLYKCSRSALGTHLGNIPNYEGDYVDLRESSGLELRQRLIQFFATDRPQSCLHCNGASSVMPAGVQIPRFQIMR